MDPYSAFIDDDSPLWSEDTVHMVLLGLSFTISLVMVTILFLLRLLQSPSRSEHGTTLSTMLLLGAGGHTSEMIALVRGLDWNKYKPLHIVVGRGDWWSREQVDRIGCPFQQHEVFRVRKPRQSWFTTPITFVLSMVDALMVLRKCRPDVVIVNGPGTCIPLSVLAKMLFGCRVIYVESFCRTETLSTTGHIMYRVADKFLVQWPKLQKLYPNAHYCGILV